MPGTPPTPSHDRARRRFWGVLPAPITAAPSAVEVSPPGGPYQNRAARPAAATGTRGRFPTGPSVAFFDLDHTIIDTNSSWHWVRHEMNHGGIGVGITATALLVRTYALGFGAAAEKAGADDESPPGRKRRI